MSDGASIIKANARRRGITRLCHFTPSRNLAHILHDPRGLLASEHLRADERAVFNPTDDSRIDGHLDYVCCSIQYPNAWYFRVARGKDVLFKDWVVLLLHPRHLWAGGAKFCRRNAAAAAGSLVREGAPAFDGLFDQTVQGRDTYTRGPRHPDFLPTDQQAEVLVPDNIERTDLIGIAVRDEAQAKRETAALRLQHMESPQFVIAPAFYHPERLNRALKSGTIPPERVFLGEFDDGR